MCVGSGAPGLAVSSHAVKQSGSRTVKQSGRASGLIITTITHRKGEKILVQLPTVPICTASWASLARWGTLTGDTYVCVNDLFLPCTALRRAVRNHGCLIFERIEILIRRSDSTWPTNLVQVRSPSHRRHHDHRHAGYFPTLPSRPQPFRPRFQETTFQVPSPKSQVPRISARIGRNSSLSSKLGKKVEAWELRGKRGKAGRARRRRGGGGGGA